MDIDSSHDGHHPPTGDAVTPLRGTVRFSVTEPLAGQTGLAEATGEDDGAATSNPVPLPTVFWLRYLSPLNPRVRGSSPRRRTPTELDILDNIGSAQFSFGGILRPWVLES